MMKLIHPEENDPTPRAASVMIVLVPTDSLKPAPWNPEGRTSKAALNQLVRSMQEQGFLDCYPILIGTDGYVGDGHRRRAAAQIAGIKRVPVIYTKMPARVLWANNAGARFVTPKEWMAAGVIGEVVTPDNVKKYIELMRPSMGDGGMRWLIDQKASPTIWRVTEKVAAHCKRNDYDFLQKTTYWLVRHKMSNVVQNQALAGPEEDRIDPRQLIQAIENDYPLRSYRVWEQSKAS
jgi:hypothetical protein